MQLKYDGLVGVAVGPSCQAKRWKNVQMTWGGLVDRLTAEDRTSETLAEFLQMPKEDQTHIKDHGGFVGGRLLGPNRSPENVAGRSLLTLDIDSCPEGLWGLFTCLYGCAAVMHGTHKSRPGALRCRLVIPLAREVSPEECQAVGRKVAGALGIELFDRSTFEPNRLMFWPTQPKDTPLYYEIQDGPFLDPEEVLSEYTDWRDRSEWPAAEGDRISILAEAKRQGDPETKAGLVGVFCRAHPIEDAIETYLTDVYRPTGSPGRYTYINGSTSGGLIIYEGKFAYSHHNTDPAGGRLCNSYDLVRAHKFGHLSETEATRAMNDFIRADEELKKRLAEERLAEARYDFAEGSAEKCENLAEKCESDDGALSWMAGLEIDAKGQYLSNDRNLNLIFRNDPNLLGLFARNDFDNRPYILRAAPWRDVGGPEPMTNTDLAGARNYIGTIYGMTSNQKVEDAVTLELERQKFHPVREYLNALEWDGQKRIETFLIEYFGAEDTPYVRDVLYKVLGGAVARVYRPGIKFDLVLMLEGPQGIGKSTFVRKLGGPWASDTFMTMQGKESFEQLQGAWLIEMAELAGLRKAEAEAVKHFISKTEDSFRPAYGRVVETYPRQCIFIGTTNSHEFLKDPTGARRFLPVECRATEPTKDIFKMEQNEIDQVWAEARDYYLEGGPLYLTEEAERAANTERAEHEELDPREGQVRRFLETLLPKNWDDLNLFERRDFLEDPTTQKGTEQRLYVTGYEIWCECLGNKRADFDANKARDIGNIMRRIPGWKQAKNYRNTQLYGYQRYYFRELY